MSAPETGTETVLLRRGAPEALRTVSLRRRVTWATIGLVGVVLALVVFTVNTLFSTLSQRDLAALVQDKIDTVAADVQKYVKGALTEAQLQTKLKTVNGVHIQLVLADGTIVGDRTMPSEDEWLPNPKWVNHAVPEVKGAKLTIVGDAAFISETQLRLRRLLVGVSVAALGFTTLVVILLVRIALEPLETMAELARSIARGDRGRRLTPTRVDTELGRTAAAFDSMLDELEGAERHARLSEYRMRRFVADAAHELRTPIAGVQAVAEAVLQAGHSADAAETERMHLLLVRETRRAGRLVDDLLSLAKIDAGLDLQIEPVELLALARVEADRTKLLGKGITVDVTGSALTVYGDSQRLSQILANLLNNARRYTPEGGTIKIQVGPVYRPVGDVGTSQPLAEIVVSDTGPGIAESDRERVFERLVRLDTSRDQGTGGAGLGLAIARGIARAHGGDLTCDPPRPDQTGAVFRLVLPLPLTDAPTQRLRRPGR